jgi:ATP-dependent Clp protease ATP-binding subunit ClpC
MYERFTDRARKVMQLANQEAERFNHEYIGTEHMLLGLVKEGSGVAANVLKNLDIDLRKIRLEVEKIVQTGPSGEQVVLGKRPHTPRAKKVIEYSIDEARGLNHNYVGSEHLLLGLLREQEGVAAQVLMNLGLKLEDVREEVLNLLGHNLPESSHLHAADDRAAKPTRSNTPALDEIGHDLTDLARKEGLRPLIGRQAELAAVCEVLACRSRKNPLLLGEPGVGKRTIVAGLARSIADDRAPEWFRNWRVVLLSVADLWADGQVARTVSERARAIFNEVRQTTDTILFLPDAIASLGTPAGGSVAERVHAQLLAALWTDQVPFIFTATPAEYQRCLKVRPAFAGFVQEVDIRPATLGETAAVLNGVCDRYTAHHGVGITDESMAAAAATADRHLPGALPGKAVQLLDRAAARARTRAWQSSAAARAATADLNARMHELNRQKVEAVGAHDFERAAEFRNQVDALRTEKERVLQEFRERGELPDAVVNAAVVAEVLRDMASDVPASGP